MLSQLYELCFNILVNYRSSPQIGCTPRLHFKLNPFYRGVLISQYEETFSWYGTAFSMFWWVNNHVLMSNLQRESSVKHKLAHQYHHIDYISINVQRGLNPCIEKLAFVFPLHSSRLIYLKKNGQNESLFNV